MILGSLPTHLNVATSARHTSSLLLQDVACSEGFLTVLDGGNADDKNDWRAWNESRG